MKGNNEELKKELLNGLEASDSDIKGLEEILESEEIPTLGEDFTAQVMQRIKAYKKPSPIVKITRIALPLTACAAALVICISLGINSIDKYVGLDTVHSEKDSVYQYSADSGMNKESIDAAGIPQNGEPESADTDAAYSYDMPMDSVEEVTDDSLIEAEAEADMGAAEEPAEAPSTAAGSSAPSQKPTQTADIYAYNNTVALGSIETFTVSAEETGPLYGAYGEIVLTLSSNYAEYSLFGTEYTEEDTGIKYEIVTVSTATDKETFLEDVEEYIFCLSSEMSVDIEGEDWTISLSDVYSLPDALTPETQIKVIKEQNTEE